jgi:hypothetical protein
MASGSGAAVRIPPWIGRVLLFAGLLGILNASSLHAQPGYIRSPRLGITFINSLENPANDLRYQRALLLGAGWNRWPLYWDRIERAPNVYDWTNYDRVVNDDVIHGLRMNTILLGRPAFYDSGGSIANLNAPAFADGTDTSAPGKAPNPANPWAMFVANAVMRYKPGGFLATQLGWPAGTGVTVWEAWNEPDLEMFWRGGVAEYARLLKVTYLVAHAADPNAQVMFGGLAYGNPDQQDWLNDTLAILARDPNRAVNNWYMDIVAVHSYTNPGRTGRVIRRIRENLNRYGLGQPIWLNESGVPVWDDYPGAIWTSADPAGRRYRSTMQQQAAYIIQSSVLAWANGADVIFLHQLYDDCGNQPGNFPPHNGELCSALPICAGDAYGLYRNERTGTCFSQHPLPGSPRPGASAYYRLAEIFGTVPFNTPRIRFRDGATIVSFDRPQTGERVVVMWNRTAAPLDLVLPAAGDTALLYAMDDQDYSLTPTQNQYTIGLEPATPDGYPFLQPGEVAAIGGPPLILIERVLRPLPDDDALAESTAEGTLPPAQEIILVTATPQPRPTVDPALDTAAPIPTMESLPATSPLTFTVRWSATDDSGIAQYLMWVQADGGAWQPWLETTATEAQFTGAAGVTYAFAVWAVDLAGNWSLNTELTPQTQTTVSG